MGGKKCDLFQLLFHWCILICKFCFVHIVLELRYTDNMRLCFAIVIYNTSCWEFKVSICFIITITFKINMCYWFQFYKTRKIIEIKLKYTRLVCWGKKRMHLISNGCMMAGGMTSYWLVSFGAVSKQIVNCCYLLAVRWRCVRYIYELPQQIFVFFMFVKKKVSIFTTEAAKLIILNFNCVYNNIHTCFEGKKMYIHTYLVKKKNHIYFIDAKNRNVLSGL